MTKLVLSFAAATFAMGLGAANAADSFPNDLSPQHFQRHSNPTAFPTAATAQSALAARGVVMTQTRTSPSASVPGSIPQSMQWMAIPTAPSGGVNN